MGMSLSRQTNAGTGVNLKTMVGKGTRSAYRDGPLPPTPSDLAQAEEGDNLETRVGGKRVLFAQTERRLSWDIFCLVLLCMY